MNPLVQDWFEREPTTTKLGPHEDSECSRDGQPAISRGGTAIALVNQQERCSVLGSEGDPPLPDVWVAPEPGEFDFRNSISLQ